MNQTLQTKLSSLKKTPLGLRERIRQMKHIQNLSETSSARKRRIKQANNSLSQLCGLDLHCTTDRIQTLNEIMNKKDNLEILNLPENLMLREIVLRELLKDKNSIINPSQVVEACDIVGVSRKEYRALS